MLCLYYQFVFHSRHIHSEIVSQVGHFVSIVPKQAICFRNVEILNRVLNLNPSMKKPTEGNKLINFSQFNLGNVFLYIDAPNWFWNLNIDLRIRKQCIIPFRISNIILQTTAIGNLALHKWESRWFSSNEIRSGIELSITHLIRLQIKNSKKRFLQ